MKNTNIKEIAITVIIKASGYSAIFFVALIFYFLLSQGLPTFKLVPLSSLFSVRWYPIEEYYGILPLISGSLVVTIGATLIAVPFGVGTAIFIAEIAPRWAREILKPIIEILAGLPSVVLGFIGIVMLSTFLRELFNLPTGLSAFTGSHSEYHTPRDTPDRINYEGTARIARFMALAARNLLVAEDVPEYIAQSKP